MSVRISLTDEQAHTLEALVDGSLGSTDDDSLVRILRPVQRKLLRALKSERVGLDRYDG
jgi:hypothetical protein